MEPTTPVTTSETSSTEFSSSDFTPIGRLFQQPNIAEKQAEEVLETNLMDLLVIPLAVLVDCILVVDET